MALTGTAIPRSFSADSLVDPRWNQLPTSGVVPVPLVPATPSSSGVVSEPYTSIQPPRVQCPLPYIRYPKTLVSSRFAKLQSVQKPSYSLTTLDLETVTIRLQFPTGSFSGLCP